MGAHLGVCEGAAADDADHEDAERERQLARLLGVRHGRQRLARRRRRLAGLLLTLDLHEGMRVRRGQEG